MGPITTVHCLEWQVHDPGPEPSADRPLTHTILRGEASLEAHSQTHSALWDEFLGCPKSCFFNKTMFTLSSSAIMKEEMEIMQSKEIKGS